MKAVILMGGSGSRLSPLNEVCNKHLINVGGKPMAQWNVEKLVNVGITEILIVTGKEHMGSIVSYFGSGSSFGCKFTYRVQDEAGGIAQALGLIESFPVRGERFIVILGDNIFQDDLKGVVDEMKKSDVVLTTTKSDTPERFGVYHDGTIEEKPENPKSNDIICGIYGYTEHPTFYKTIQQLKVSERGELEITDLNNYLLQEGIWKCGMVRLEGWWTDAGCHDTLIKANNLVYGQE